MRKLIDRFGGNWVFLTAVLGVYAIISIFNSKLILESFSYAGTLAGEVFPILGLVFGLIFLANLLMTKKIILKYLGDGSGIRGWVMAVVFGVISSGPAYMWYPLLSELKDKGMKEALISTFIYARAVKIPLIPIMIYYFSLPFVLVLSLYILLFSIIVGFFTGKLLTPKS